MNPRYQQGLQTRRQVLGDDHVDRSLANYQMISTANSSK